jgi:two-component system CheB/CheR fusion protein
MKSKSRQERIKNNDPDLISVLNFLRREKGVDFEQYKTATIKRRILRRMLFHKLNSLKEYIAYLEKKPEEIKILFKDLLINTTSFFRDSEVYQFLKKILFPKILKDKKEGEALRIWLPACATGEEVYSIAMILFELKKSSFGNHPLQLFATDVNEEAISKARLGEYTADQLESVSPGRVRRFYSKIGDRFRIIKELRKMCVFAVHNILIDPPFSKIDFVSCRNLLIYLNASAQQNIIRIFHYALKPDGYLMLGKAETIGKSTELFTPIYRNHKIFKRKEWAGKRKLLPLSDKIITTTGNRNLNSIKNDNAVDRHFSKDIDSLILNHYTPAGVVINYNMEILQFRGNTKPFLKHSAGKASLNILKMILPELALELRYAISAAIKKKRSVHKTGIEIKSKRGTRIISLEVIRVSSAWKEPLLLVLFTEPEQVETFLLPPDEHGQNALDKNKVIAKLKKELQMLRSDMKAYVHEQEMFTQELQNANEEVVSSNEELQGVNEELEASKEEIKSTNEELLTTNQELETRNELLNESYEYSEAIINTIHEPMLVLDKELRIKSANRAFYKTFKVREEETASAFLFDLGNGQWDIPRLRELLIEIIQKNAHFHDFEVVHNFQNIGRRTMLLNASRIVQKGHGEQSILLAFKDITEHALLQMKEKELLKKDVMDSKNYSMKLELAVDERTKEIENVNKELAVKNIELGKMNAELESFAYVSSHDLQEPLRKIQTFASRILETETHNLSDKGKDYFNRMQNASSRMKRLIEDLLAFSRLGIDDRNFESTNLSKIVTEVKIELREVIEEKNAVIEAVDLCTVNIIPFQFRQLMHNLINNALKFSHPERPPHIVIECTMVEGATLDPNRFRHDKNYWHISITDNGIGFDQQYEDRIFQVFQKLHGKHEYAGTGIGLAIVKKIIDNHRGIITVSSRLHEGTTFNIYLPTDEKLPMSFI